MDEERKSWEQRIDDGEPDLWYGRFVKFLRLGSKRSVNTIYAKEQRATRNNEKQRELNAPGEWYDIEKEWNWKKRARDYDEYQRAEEDRIIEEEREKVLRSGFALQHKRIELLDKLSRKLIRYTNDEAKIWIPETKTTITTQGKDKTQEQIVEKIVFNAPLFQQIRTYQADIAAEMGERVKKKDITITEMPPSVYLGFDPDQDGSETKEGDDGSEQALPDNEL